MFPFSLAKNAFVPNWLTLPWAMSNSPFYHYAVRKEICGIKVVQVNFTVNSFKMLHESCACPCPHVSPIYEAMTHGPIQLSWICHDTLCLISLSSEVMPLEFFFVPCFRKMLVVNCIWEIDTSNKMCSMHITVYQVTWGGNACKQEKISHELMCYKFGWFHVAQLYKCDSIRPSSLDWYLSTPALNELEPNLL